MIPSHVKIGPQIWEVILSNHIDNDEEGACNDSCSHIIINQRLSEQARESTFIHELLHAACTFAGIGNNEKLTEEQFVTRTEKALHMILKDNGFWPSDLSK